SHHLIETACMPSLTQRRADYSLPTTPERPGPRFQPTLASGEEVGTSTRSRQIQKILTRSTFKTLRYTSRQTAVRTGLRLKERPEETTIINFGSIRMIPNE